MTGATRRPNPVWLVAGVVGWAGLGWLAISMFNQTPRTAAFDLELLLQAGRDIAAGRSPYVASMIAGQAPGSTDLFYSYPPPVAQAFSVVAGVPSAVMFGALWVAAVGGLAVVTGLIGRAFPGAARRYLVPALAVAPLFLPFGVGLLFGNLDVLFPLAYGLVMVAAVSGQRADQLAGGVALALAAIAKIHPGSLGVWFLVRAIRERFVAGRSPSAIVLAAAIATGLAVLLASVIAGGADLWREYIPVAGAASGARLLDPRNAGPAAQLALFLGGEEGLVRTMQVPITLGALVATIAAAAWVRDSLTSVAVAAVASLVVLPVTWYHYPAALIPFAIAAAARSAMAQRDDGRTRWLLLAAGVTATVAIAWLPLLYVAVGLGLAGVHTSGSTGAPRPSPTRLSEI
jgi:hypothetical protein